MTPSVRAIVVAQLAVALHCEAAYRPGDSHDPVTGTARRKDRLTREAAEWLAAAERVVAERAPARPEMCESCGGAEDDDAQAA